VDITDRRAVQQAWPAADTVYHLAAAWRREHPQRDLYRLVNVEATRNLLEAARGAGIGRFVHCSTVGVHGHVAHPPADEDCPYAPGDHYQRSKLEGELLARHHFAAGLPGTVVRPAGIYGPGDLRFLKLFRAIRHRRFVMVGSGRTLFHAIYVDDLAEGVFLAGHRPQAEGQVLLLAGPRYTTLNELVATLARVLGVPAPRWRVPYLPVYLAALACSGLCRALGREPPLYPRRVAFFANDRAFSTARAERLLGYRPRVDLEEGLRLSAEWYAARGLL
jgi:nucleoside-diphosphate-sugar epimerase